MINDEILQARINQLETRVSQLEAHFKQSEAVRDVVKYAMMQATGAGKVGATFSLDYLRQIESGLTRPPSSRASELEPSSEAVAEYLEKTYEKTYEP